MYSSIRLFWPAITLRKLGNLVLAHLLNRLNTDAVGIYRLVVQIESAEINRMFQAALASSNSEFVRRLGAFRSAVETHITYITGRLPQLDPHFALASRELRDLYPRPTG